VNAIKRRTAYHVFIFGNPIEDRAENVTRDEKWLENIRLLQLNAITGNPETTTSKI
jgi:hypothetical protein